MMDKPRIDINFGVQRDGFVFRLRPTSMLWLDENYPDRRQVDSVFIGFDTRREIAQIPQSSWDHIVELLTGFPIEDMNEIGGFRVVHPVTQEEVYNSLLVHA